MDFFRSTQWAMARGTYASRSQIVFTLASLSTLSILNSSVSFPSSQIQGSSHEQTIARIPPYLFPPTLDGSRSPRTDIGDARQISGGWLASTEPQPKSDQIHRMGQASLGQVRDHPSSIMVRVADSILSGTVSISESIPINTYWKADPRTSKPRLTGFSAQQRRRPTRPSVRYGKGCAKVTASRLSSRWTASQPNK
jgi:hypothetical protein